MNALVLKVVADVLGVDQSTLEPGTGPADIDSWDSAKHIELILTLEEALGIRFDPSEIAQMTDVGTVDRLARQHLGS